ncbi:TetR family transcriptional regulator [Paractinoplanes deccanensis]|uniref:TetR family transcriptional regulator n=1 Tax=Paractinoplanes deccanensis TaxID=113561 RepID=A0ABQ3YIE3_9ACTN|nr:TetR/AcrR family transcriptional regulator [Actinoplanes deccanensis]GID79767.1 TetR family transcriptional regulator [Actinoplanes deccanensis]
MTTARGTRRAQAAAETRELILGAARECFAAGGYAGTTINEIASAAGVAVATVYTSVGGKPVLLEQLVRRGMEDAAVGEALDRVARAETGEQVVLAIAEGTGAAYRRHDGVIALLLDTASHEPVAQRLLEESVRVYRTALAQAAERLRRLGVLAPDLDTERATDVLWFFFGLYSWPRVLKGATWTWEEAGAWLCSTASLALLAEGRAP